MHSGLEDVLVADTVGIGLSFFFWGGGVTACQVVESISLACNPHLVQFRQRFSLLIK